jgi:hemolysin activation/secretion protein
VGIMESKCRLLQLCLAPLVYLLLAWPAAAQVVELPSTADPARLPPSTPVEFGRTPAGPDFEITAPEELDIHLAHPALLQAVAIRGATVYSEAALSPAWSSFLGRSVGNEDLGAIAGAITRQYQTNGYMLSRARLAEFDGSTGTAAFEVIEGYVSEVRIKGLSNMRQMTRLQAYARKIRNSRPLQARVLYRYLYLMDDIPGMHTSVDLEINRAEPGAVLEIEVSYKAFAAGAGLNNRGTRYIGPQRAAITTGVNGLLGLDEGISLGFTTTPPNVDELLYGEARWKQILDDRGTQLMLGGTWYRSQPDIRLDPPATALIGSGSIYSVGLRYPVIRSGKENMAITVGYNHELATARVTLPEPGLRLYRDRLRSLVVVLSGHRMGEQNDISASVSVTRGFKIFGAEDSPSLPSRRDGKPDFTKLNTSASFRRSFGSDWKWSFFLAGTGQYSFDPLLAGEEFGLGGVESVRAFDPSTFSGDSGAAATVELRYDKPRPIQHLNHIQSYIFFDAGTISNRGDDQDSSASATAAGTGLRFQVVRPNSGRIDRVLPNVDGYVEAAWPIGHSPDTTHSYDFRFLFGLVLRN